MFLQHSERVFQNNSLLQNEAQEYHLMCCSQTPDDRKDNMEDFVPSFVVKCWFCRQLTEHVIRNVFESYEEGEAVTRLLTSNQRLNVNMNYKKDNVLLFIPLN